MEDFPELSYFLGVYDGCDGAGSIHTERTIIFTTPSRAAGGRPTTPRLRAEGRTKIILVGNKSNKSASIESRH